MQVILHGPALPSKESENFILCGRYSESAKAEPKWAPM